MSSQPGAGGRWVTRSSVKYGGLQLLTGRVCSRKAAMKGDTMKGRNPGLTGSCQLRNFGPDTRAPEKAGWESWPPTSHGHASPGLPVPAGCSSRRCRLLGFLTCCPLWPWLLLLDGPPPPRKQHVLEKCLSASAKPTPQTGQDTPQQAPRDSPCGPERPHTLAYYLPFSTLTGACLADKCLQSQRRIHLTQWAWRESRNLHF